MNKEFKIPKLLPYSLILFFSGYIISLFYPSYFRPTDTGFYLDLIEGTTSRAANSGSFTEPLFALFSRLLGLFLNTDAAFIILILISLVIKAVFISVYFQKKNLKHFSILLFVIVYFLCFFDRHELGSLRNAYAIDIIQFIVLSISFRKKILLVGISYFIHFPTAIFASFWLLYAYLLNINKLTSYTLIKTARGNIFKIFNWVSKIFFKQKTFFRTLLFSSSLIFGMVIFRLERLTRVFNDILVSGYFSYGSFNHRLINPFGYYRIYMLIFTCLSLYYCCDLILRNRSLKIKLFKNISLKSICFELDIFIVSFLLIFSLCFLPLSLAVTRYSFVIAYFALFSNLNVLVPSSELILLKFRYLKSFFIMFLSTLVSFSLIIGASYTKFFVDSYQDRILERKLELKEMSK